MAFTGDRVERISKALEQIRKRNGGKITPRLVVEAARNPRHPLHDEFDWDDKSAAEKQREDTARQLIKYVTTEVITERKTFSTVVYVRDPDTPAKEQGYIAITGESLEREHAMRIMAAELGRCESAIERARGVVAILEREHKGIAQQLEDMLEQIILMKGMVTGGIHPEQPGASPS